MHRFRIGDLVTTLGAIEQMKKFGLDRSIPSIFTVSTRVTQECPGGVQYLYGLGFDDGRLVLDHMLASVAELDAAVSDVKEAMRKEFREKFRLGNDDRAKETPSQV